MLRKLAAFRSSDFGLLRPSVLQSSDFEHNSWRFVGFEIGSARWVIECSHFKISARTGPMKLASAVINTRRLGGTQGGRILKRLPSQPGAAANQRLEQNESIRASSVSCNLFSMSRLLGTAGASGKPQKAVPIRNRDRSPRGKLRTYGPGIPRQTDVRCPALLASPAGRGLPALPRTTCVRGGRSSRKVH